MARVQPEQEAELEDLPVEDEEGETPRGDLLDLVDPRQDGMPTSDDTPPPVDAPVRLEGTEAIDALTGGGGADTILGADGGDMLAGGDGRDAMSGGAGDDELAGEADADRLRGGAGADTLLGGGSDDRLRGDAGSDSLAGQMGDDSLLGDAGADSLLGGSGRDILSGGTGNDWLAGGQGDDMLRGGTGADILDGDDGDDTLAGGLDRATDFLNGGAGDDRISLSGSDYGTGGEGADSFVLGEGVAGDPAILADFEPGVDRIELSFDPADPPPVVTVEDVEGGQQILVDGVPLAFLKGMQGLDASIVEMTARQA